jgi:hypothetical protein
MFIESFYRLKDTRQDLIEKFPVDLALILLMELLADVCQLRVGQ